MLYLLLTLSTPVSAADVDVHRLDLAGSNAALEDARRRVGLGFTFAPIVGLGGWAAVVAAAITAAFSDDHGGAVAAFSLLSIASFISCIVLFAMAGGGITRLRRAKRRLRQIYRNPSGFEF